VSHRQTLGIAKLGIFTLHQTNSNKALKTLSDEILIITLHTSAMQEYIWQPCWVPKVLSRPLQHLTSTYPVNHLHSTYLDDESCLTSPDPHCQTTKGYRYPGEEHRSQWQRTFN